MILTKETRISRTKTGKRRALSWLLWLLAILATTIVGALIYLKMTIDNIVQPTPEQAPVSAHKENDDYMLNFLLMGVDNDSEREKTGLEGTRTDSLMLISLNTESEKLTVYSIPRDTTTILYDDKGAPQEIANQYANKINAAYQFGGEEATINTVENLFDGIEIDYYATVNFISFKGIVDSIGGIEVDVPEDIYNRHLTEILVNKGKQTLNGSQALDMARARYQDDDINRGYRQQIVMEAIASKMLSNISLSESLGVLKSVNGNVKTNLTLTDMKDLYSALSGKSLTFDKVTTSWGSFLADGASMVYLNAAARSTVVDQINSSIGRSSNIESIVSGSTNLQYGLNEIENQIVNYGYTELPHYYLNSLFENEFQ